MYKRNKRKKGFNEMLDDFMKKSNKKQKEIKNREEIKKGVKKKSGNKRKRSDEVGKDEE